MACSACGKRKENKVTVKSSYVPKTNSQVKMSDVIMSFTVEKKSNDSIGANKANN